MSKDKMLGLAMQAVNETIGNAEKQATYWPCYLNPIDGELWIVVGKGNRGIGADGLYRVILDMKSESVGACYKMEE